MNAFTATVGSVSMTPAPARHHGRMPARLGGVDLGIGVRQCEDHVVVGHQVQPLSPEHPRPADPDEDVGLVQRLGQAAGDPAGVGAGGKLRLRG